MNKITFKCVRSGNFVSFTNEDDIAGLRKHEGYIEVKDAQAAETVQAVPIQATPKEVLSLKRNRPAKGVMPSFLQE